MFERKQGKKVKILIADDESSLRTLVRVILETNPAYEIIEAVDGNDTLSKIRVDKPHILILDIMMPGLSGFEVCEKIKQDDILKDMVVIILTAKGQQTDRDWAQSVGADHFLTKPFSPVDLLSLVDRIAKELLNL